MVFFFFFFISLAEILIFDISHSQEVAIIFYLTCLKIPQRLLNNVKISRVRAHLQLRHNLDEEPVPEPQVGGRGNHGHTTWISADLLVVKRKIKGKSRKIKPASVYFYNTRSCGACSQSGLRGAARQPVF